MNLYTTWNGKKIVNDEFIADTNNLRLIVERKSGETEDLRILARSIGSLEILLPTQIFVGDKVYITGLNPTVPVQEVKNCSVATTHLSYDSVPWEQFDILLAFGKGSGKDFVKDYPLDILDGIPKVRHGTWISESATSKWPNVLKGTLNSGTINIADATGDPEEYFAEHIQILKDRCLPAGVQGVIDRGRGWADIAGSMPLMIDVESLVPWWTPNPLDPEGSVNLYNDWNSEETIKHYNYWVTKLYNLTWRTLVDEIGHDEIYFYHSTRSDFNLDYDFWQKRILGRNPFWLNQQPYLTGVAYPKSGTNITSVCDSWSKIHVSLAEAKALGKKFYAIIGVGYFDDKMYEPKYTANELKTWFEELRLRGVDGCIIWASTDSNDSDMYNWVKTQLKTAVI